MSREELMERTEEIFSRVYGGQSEKAVAAPGRSNIIGEHTDYNDGHVLPIAIDRFTVAAARSRSDRTVKFYSENFGEGFSIDLDEIHKDYPPWGAYVVGVVAEMEKTGYRLHGKEIAIYGNVPLGSGLSSSAAVEVCVATVVERLEGYSIPDAELVNICRRGDHNFVGVKSGPMDQFASRACRAGHAGLLDCRSLVMEHYRLPDGLIFLSIYSGIPRSLATSEYNERQESCQKAVDILRQKYPEVRALRDATVEMVEAMCGEMGDRVCRRAMHVVTEQWRVQEMVAAIQAGDEARIGHILLEGHRSLSENYEVSLPILDEMVDWLYSRPGIVGARLTGAGFGGSLIGVAKEQEVDVDALKNAFLERFGARTPEDPQLWKLVTVDGAKYSE